MSELIQLRESDEVLEEREECAEKLAELNFTPTEEHPENTENPWLGRREINTPFGAHRIFVVPHQGIHQEPLYMISPELSEEEVVSVYNQLPSHLERIAVMKYEGYWGFTDENYYVEDDIRLPLGLNVVEEIQFREFSVRHTERQSIVRVFGELPTTVGSPMNVIGMKSPGNNHYVLRIFPPNEMLHSLISDDMSSLITRQRGLLREIGKIKHSTVSIDEQGFLRIIKDEKLEFMSLQDEATNMNILHRFADTETRREYPGEVNCSARVSSPYLLFTHHNAAEMLEKTRFIQVGN